MKRAFAYTLIAVAAIAAAAFSTSSAHAEIIGNGTTLTVKVDGFSPVTLDSQAVLDNGDGVFSYLGSHTLSSTGDGPDDLILSWNISSKADPFVFGSIAVTNLAGTPQDFSFSVTLPVAPPTPGGHLAAGSVGVTVSDGRSDGATFTSNGNNPLIPIYRASIDGTPFQDLNPPLPIIAPAKSSSTGSAAFGAVAAGPVSTSLAVDLAFRLTSRDSAGISFNFSVVPVPEPSSIVLAGMGVVGLVAVGLKRRRRSGC